MLPDLEVQYASLPASSTVDYLLFGVTKGTSTDSALWSLLPPLYQ